MASEPAETTSVALKVLLVADEVFRGDEFMAELRRHVDGRSEQVELFVIAPALADTALEHEMAATDGPIKEASERLDSILAELKRVGIQAVGEVGDADPVVAIGDGLREFEADEIIIVGHTDEDQTYGEKGLWKRVKNEFHQPVVELVVGGADSDGMAPRVVETRHDVAHEQTDREILEGTRNFPPLTRRDLFGILVGFIGTVALGLIAVAAGTEQSGNISGAAAAVVLLAIGSFLINAANIVGLLLFESVRYTGVWDKFLARSALIYTVGALIAALILWSMV